MATSPMLAKTYDPHNAKSHIFPCLVQPKLDGVRMLAMIDSRHPVSTIRLSSRTGNSFDHLLPLFQAELQQFPAGTVLDGELYKRDLGFQSIVSLVKNKNLTGSANEVEYHVYDVVQPNISFRERERWLRTSFKQLHHHPRMKLVESRLAATADDADAFLDEAIAQGYEGIMLRNFNTGYEAGKRSASLLKYKRFEDADFTIVDCEEASGKDAGTAVFVCESASGPLFRVRPVGTLAERRRMLKDANRLIGKKLTVRFQMLTDDGIPRFPVGIAVRDYE